MDGSTGRLQMRRLLSASPADQRRVIAAMTPLDMLMLDADFESWAHDSQLAPPGEGWRCWLMMAGRGFGKTRAGAEWVNALANAKPKSRIALVGASLAEARSVMVEGVSGVLSVARRRRRQVKWEPSLGRLTWPNGSEAQLFSGDQADGLRGPEHQFAWCASGARFAGCASNRDRAAKCTASRAGERQLLRRRIGADRCLGREGGAAGVVDRGRLALPEPGRRPRFVCQKHRSAR